MRRGRLPKCVLGSGGHGFVDHDSDVVKLQGHRWLEFRDSYLVRREARTPNPMMAAIPNRASANPKCMSISDARPLVARSSRIVLVTLHLYSKVCTFGAIYSVIGEIG